MTVTARGPAGPSLLVIGYGNDLRRDDGAGRVVADRVEALGLDGVTVRSVVQLVPELATDIAAADHVVFVDASVAGPGDGPAVDEPEIVEVVAAPDHLGLAHHATPAGLLALAGAVSQRRPRSTVISIPADDLGIGAGLSPPTDRAATRAVELVVALAGTQVGGGYAARSSSTT
ncbi:MAG: hydrogenase maturation protease [Actinomycetota bacterium]|nr:hydrogenase maturation protease [Actinomycetota bacterium]